MNFFRTKIMTSRQTRFGEDADPDPNPKPSAPSLAKVLRLEKLLRAAQDAKEEAVALATKADLRAKQLGALETTIATQDKAIVEARAEGTRWRQRAEEAEQGGKRAVAALEAKLAAKEEENAALAVRLRSSPIANPVDTLRDREQIETLAGELEKAHACILSLREARWTSYDAKREQARLKAAQEESDAIADLMAAQQRETRHMAEAVVLQSELRETEGALQHASTAAVALGAKAEQLLQQLTERTEQRAYKYTSDYIGNQVRTQAAAFVPPPGTSGGVPMLKRPTGGGPRGPALRSVTNLRDPASTSLPVVLR